MTLSYQVGKQGEKEALEWFLTHRTVVEGTQSRLLAQNYRCRWGEIDLILEEMNVERQILELVFIEVRIRSKSKNRLIPAESITQSKQRKLKRTAEHYLAHYRGHATTLRFDFLGWNGESWEHRFNIAIG